MSIDIGKMAEDAGRSITDAAMAAGKGISDAAKAAGKGIGDAAKVVGDTATSAVGTVESAVKSAMPGGEKSPITEEQIQELLGICYTKAIGGIPKVSKPIDQLVEDYTARYSNVYDAAKAMINMQLVKNTTSGFLSGLSGFLALPVTLASIPANISNVLYVQMRMVAALAKMGGYDINSDQVQTMIYVCLTGSAATDILKEAGIKVAGKFAKNAIEKIPRAVLTKINQAVGFRLLTKFGETGIINLGKLIPVAGGVVGGAFDFATTRIIANTAYTHFVSGEEEVNVIDDDTIEVIELENTSADNLQLNEDEGKREENND